MRGFGPEYSDKRKWKIPARGADSILFRAIPEVEAEWVEAQIQPVFDDGSASRLLGVSRDVTSHKRRRQQLGQQNERFDEMASVIAHDLQTRFRRSRDGWNWRYRPVRLLTLWTR